MGDLHCPATLLLTAYADAAQARELGERLRSRRVSHVWAGGSPETWGTAEVVASVLGVGVTVREELGAGPGSALRAVLEEVADGHRGETVLVVTDAGVLQLALRALTLPERALLETVELTSDEHGWTRIR